MHRGRPVELVRDRGELDGTGDAGEPVAAGQLLVVGMFAFCLAIEGVV
jgi:hypothetical protein